MATSVHLAEHLQTPREVWLGKAALGKVLARLGRDKEAEAQLTQATQTIEAIAANLHTPRLRHSFLSGAQSWKSTRHWGTGHPMKRGIEGNKGGEHVMYMSPYDLPL